MKTIISGFLSAWAFITRIPMPFTFKLRYSGVIPHSSSVGVVLALPLCLLFWGFQYISFPAMPGAVVLVAVQYLMANLFHFDGLLDSADALLPHIEQKKRFEILKDPRSGSFAVWAGGIALLFRVALISYLIESDFSILLSISLFPIVLAFARFAAGFTVFFISAARDEGLGKAVAETSLIEHLLIGLVWIFLGCYGFYLCNMPWWIPLATFGITLVFLRITIIASYKKKLGGFTGDCIGAAIEMGELIMWTSSLLFILSC